MNNIGWFKARKVSNWGYWDSIDPNGDREIVEGKYLRRFPDGSESEQDVRIEKGVEHYSDMGHPGTGPNNKAYFEHDLLGVKVKVYIVGLMVKRIA